MILDPKFLLKVGLALVCAAVVSCALTPLVKVLAKKVGAMDVPKDERRMHHVPIPRMGGLAIFLGFIVSVLIFQNLNVSTELQGILLGAVIIVILGVMDDILTLPALPKFCVQIAAAIIVVLYGCRIEHFMGFTLPDWLSYPVTVIWIVAITNAINFIDGLDGLAAGVSAISAGAMLIVALLLGAALISIGMLISALTENQVIAAVGGFAVGFSLILVDSLAGLISIDWLREFITGLSFMVRYDEFTNGILDISNVFFFVSVCAVFIFLTVRVFEKRRWS